MSSGPETRFYQGVHKLLPAYVYAMKNNNPYLGGVLDCWYSGPARDLWIEYKFLELPKRGTTELNFGDVSKKYALSALQQEWYVNRRKEGRNVGVIIGTPSGGVWMNDLTWDQSWTTERFRAELISKRDLADLITKFVSHTP